ncbi:MAG: protein phosphatase 2C domain-containing protein [Nitrososphaerota archaeon]|jgi:hypothetical protein|nr:protein phosphatase 2C domain-containing protein [Nitrososphaerota archaeon]
MIYSYGFSITGSSHKKSDRPKCQDYNDIKKLENGYIIAAIADGVGSCKYSDIAALLAVNTSLEVCAEAVDAEGDNCNFEKVIEDAFTKAERKIDAYSLSQKHLITDYDTTLSLVIYDGKSIHYGHCGDGGIIGLNNGGDYVKITTPQKSDGTFVIPLRAGKSSWKIDKAEGEYASVLLATDGVYDIFFPYLLKGQPVEVYVPLVRYFLDNHIVKISDEISEKIVSKEREKYLDSDACSSITDDKTVRVLINGDILPKMKDDSYYTEPDWDTLQLEWNKKAYPHLYKEEKNLKEKISSSVSSKISKAKKAVK